MSTSRGFELYRGTEAADTSRTVGLDLLRICMALMVVGLHGHFLSDVDQRASYLLVEGLFRVAVPVFFLISGYYLQRMDRRGFGRWVRHVLWLYVLWMAIYVFQWWPTTQPTLAGLCGRLAFGYYHLWFLIALALAGAMLFAVRAWSTARLLAVALPFALLGLAIQYAGNYHLLGDDMDRRLNQLLVYRNFLLFGFPFLTIGFLLARHEMGLRISTWTLVGALSFGFASLSVEAALNLRLAGPRETFDLLFSLYLVAPALLLWAMRLNVPVQIPGKDLAQFATGLYLVHVLVLKALGAHAGLSATPKVICCLVVSAALAAVLLRMNRRLPVL